MPSTNGRCNPERTYDYRVDIFLEKYEDGKITQWVRTHCNYWERVVWILLVMESNGYDLEYDEISQYFGHTSKANLRSAQFRLKKKLEEMLAK